VVGSRTNSGINLDTQAQLLTSQVTAKSAQGLLKTDVGPKQLLDAVSVTVPPNTQVLQVEFTASAAAAAQAGAQAFAKAFLDQRAGGAQQALTEQITALKDQRAQLDNDLEEVAGKVASLPENSVERRKAEADLQIISSQIATLGTRLSPMQAVQITPGEIISDAALPTAPSFPNPLLFIASGLGAGLLLGVVVALLVDRLRGRACSPRQVEQALGGAVLLDVRRVADANAVLPYGGEGARAFSRLRTMVASGLSGGMAGTPDVAVEAGASAEPVVVCGAGGASSRGTYVTVNLAAASARAGQRVVVVCADPHSATPEALGVSGIPGLADLLAGEDGAAAPGPSPAVPGVEVVTPGTKRLDRDVFASEDARRLLRELRTRFDLVIIEVAPPAESAEVQELAAQRGAVLFVVHRGRDRLSELGRYAVQARLVGGTILGAVLLPPSGRRQAAGLRPAATVQWAASRGAHGRGSAHPETSALPSRSRS